MADDDRQPPQAYDTMAPTGVGTTATNQVSPGTMQEILDTGDQALIDQAFDQMEQAGDYDALSRYLESLPDLPPPVQASSPAGVGSQGSQSFRSLHPPQSLPRKDHLVGEAHACRPVLEEEEEQWRVLEQQRVPGVMMVVVVVLDVVVLDVDMVVVVVVVLVVLEVLEVLEVVVVVVVDDDRDEYEDDDEIPPLHLCHVAPIQSPLKDLGRLGVHHLVRCVKQIYNDVYG